MRISIEVSISSLKQEIFGPRRRKREVPAEPSVLEIKVVQPVLPDELDPTRAMQTEIRQLFEHSAGFVSAIADVPTKFGAEGIRIIDLSSDDASWKNFLSELTPEISSFLLAEKAQRTHPELRIRAKKYMTQIDKADVEIPIHELDVFVSERRFNNERAQSYIRVTMAPNWVQVSASSALDPCSELVQLVRNSVSGETKPERDIANYAVALPIIQLAGCIEC